MEQVNSHPGVMQRMALFSSGKQLARPMPAQRRTAPPSAPQAADAVEPGPSRNRGLEQGTVRRVDGTAALNGENTSELAPKCTIQPAAAAGRTMKDSLPGEILSQARRSEARFVPPAGCRLLSESSCSPRRCSAARCSRPDLPKIRPSRPADATGENSSEAMARWTEKRSRSKSGIDSVFSKPSRTRRLNWDGENSRLMKRAGFKSCRFRPRSPVELYGRPHSNCVHVLGHPDFPSRSWCRYPIVLPGSAQF